MPSVLTAVMHRGRFTRYTIDIRPDKRDTTDHWRLIFWKKNFYEFFYCKTCPADINEDIQSALQSDLSGQDESRLPICGQTDRETGLVDAGIQLKGQREFIPVICGYTIK